jgi:DNA end-binding protein Ku
MASRAVWKGHMRLSLVSIPIEIHPASQTAPSISFVQIHAPSGQRVRHVKSVPGIGAIETSDIVKGYELGENQYMLIKPEEVDEIKLETSKSFDLVQFVGRGEIPPLYYEKPYYVIPSDPLGQQAYRVVRDALRAKDFAGLGQITMRGKEHLCAVSAYGDGLLLETLTYAEEVRSPQPLFGELEDAPADEDLLAVATQLMERKVAPFDASVFKDRYDVALRELIEAKRSNKATPRTKAAPAGPRPPSNVVDLMAALKNSLKDVRGASARRPNGGKAKVSVHPRVKETLEQPSPKPAKRNVRKTEKKAPTSAEQPKRGRSN